MESQEDQAGMETVESLDYRVIRDTLECLGCLG